MTTKPSDEAPRPVPAAYAHLREIAARVREGVAAKRAMADEARQRAQRHHAAAEDARRRAEELHRTRP